MTTKKRCADRRLPDPRIERLVNEMDTVKIHLNENTRLTAAAADRAAVAASKADEMADDVKAVREILTSFRIAGAIAKWLAAIAAAVVAVKAGWTNIVGK
jgi:hypothetical protein